MGALLYLVPVAERVFFPAGRLKMQAQVLQRGTL